MKKLKLTVTVLAICGTLHFSIAQQGPALHVNSRWRECSFQLDPALTQKSWREFTKEAGTVVYFRPLADAKPMGAGKVEVSFLQWKTSFDDRKDAWNDTFVHPDETHWLKEGSRLPFPGLTVRAGITDKLDVAIYGTKSIGANYGFYGAQAQYNLLNDTRRKWSTSARASFINMFGPEDLKLSVYGVDVLASKEFVLHERWLTLAPYGGISTFVSCAREKSDVVELENEVLPVLQGMAGLVVKVATARVAVEYNLASVNTVSMKLGVVF